MDSIRNRKLLLMGSSGAGKTSMHSVIFANYPAKDTTKIGYTTDRSEQKFKFMGNLTLNLWDCGGQDAFMKQYFTTHKQTIFKNVQVLIYVFDVQQTQDKFMKHLGDFQQALLNLDHYSPQAKVFVLIHKMDKIKQSQRIERFEKKKKVIQDRALIKIKEVNLKEFFKTSIWDQTLYQAWSQIVQLLIPNRQFISQTLKTFCQVSNCDEAVLFERSTFLIIGYHDVKDKPDLLKYEKVSNIIKQFKLTCNKIGAHIQNLVVNTSTFTAIIQQYTQTINMMVIFSNNEVKTTTISINISNSGKYFDTSMKSKEIEI